MSPEIYLLTISLPLTTAIIVFAMKYASAYAASRARIAEESERARLAKVQSAELAQIRASLSSVEAEIAAQSRAIASIETILKKVG